MVALACVIAAVFAGSLAYWATMERRRRARAVVARLAAWGKPAAVARETESVARYHELRGEEARAGVLDEGTWRDLGMDAVYAHLDRAGTFAGRARLYDRLRVPGTDLPALRRFDEVVTLFEEDSVARERVDAVLASGDPYGQDSILEVLFARFPVRRRCATSSRWWPS